MKIFRDDVRNIAIIAHVDHGKTTLVDAMLKQSGIFRNNQHVQERVMDSNDLERERGITIFSKNTSVEYMGVRINIVDTPGHADFGGEVERILKMVDGVVLLVDAFEGPMPQTRFVLRKALKMNLKPIVAINKIDRTDIDLTSIEDKILDLFIDLGASEEILDYPVIYMSAREGCAGCSPDKLEQNLKPFFDAIINYIPKPTGYVDKPLQFLVSNIDYDDYVGRIGIGKVERGKIKIGQQVAVCKKDGVIQNHKISMMYRFEGLKRIDIDEAMLGDIIAVAGIDGINIGETVCDINNPEPLPFVDVDEPTISMLFVVNNSPFAGKEGIYVTNKHLKERLFKEMETNVSLRVEETETADVFRVLGRGELHLSILIETMRRQGYEFQVSKPNVIYKEINGEIYEPIEYLTIDVQEEFLGVVMEKVGARKAEMINMSSASKGYMRLEFKIPARGLIGYRSEFLTDTKGNGVMHHNFYGYEPFKGNIPNKRRGVLVACEDGEAVTYGIYNIQDRGTLFISPGTRVYEGMIVGECSRYEDICVNVCKKKHLTSIRNVMAEDPEILVPPKNMSLEQCLGFIEDDELIEITPKNIRLRKKILNTEQRAKSRSKKQAG